MYGSDLPSDNVANLFSIIKQIVLLTDINLVDAEFVFKIRLFGRKPIIYHKPIKLIKCVIKVNKPYYRN